MEQKTITKYNILEKYFGYKSFRKGQETLIDAILSGQDVLGIMPTGAGKSICYQVPALMLPGITVVISPLISLMKDQVSALNQAGIHAAYINSSLTENQIAKAMQYAAEGRYKIIYVAPERLETQEFVNFAEHANISMVTVDEAHCISQWGQDFRPSYLKIVQFIKILPKRPIISAFTATATEVVKEDIQCVLGLCNPEVLATGFNRENLYFAVEMPKKKDAYILDYVTEHSSESGIIYCSTRKNVDAVCDKLSKEGVAVTKYHAGLSNGERQQNQEDFIYDRCPVMVATNAFGMGIDKSNVRYVIHYNMPQSMENYYQEAGRAGRDGEPSECILLYSAQDVMINRFLLENKEQNTEFTPEERKAIRERDEERLSMMTRYCTTKNCLREYILRYFGEQGEKECGNCSNCQKEFEELDVTKEARKIIECVLELRQRYGINVIAGTLRGDNRAKLREYHVADYSSFGALKELTEPAIKEIMEQMMAEQLLFRTNDKYALVKVTRLGREWMEGESRILLKKAKEDNFAKASLNSSQTSAKTKQRKSDILNSRGLELFDLLRELRTTIAREENIPPYLVFSDKTLVDMCVKLPFTKEEILSVSGVGENKSKKYGERFTNQILTFTNGEKEKLYFGEVEEVLNSTEHSRTGKENGKTKNAKQDFSLTAQQAIEFPYEEKYLVTEIAEQLNRLRDPNTTKKITGAEIFRFIMSEELASQTFYGRMPKKEVSEKGVLAGLFLGPRISKTGTEYQDIYYNEQAQSMIVEHYTRDKNS
ncbi:MAG: DNA helicase RecQ [Clostridiales bacterium]|nr:DNA helicase RecQ [Clostridiales bacterium]